MPYLSALRSDFEIKEMAFGLVASQGFLQKRYFIFSFRVSKFSGLGFGL